MTESISNFDDVQVSADYFNTWLGHEVNHIEPKLLFDLQELFKHYASIIVPDKTVKVNYPTFDTSACADTENDVIYIPTSVLKEGDIDNTIGLVVHELQHLNLSLKSSDNIMFCFRFLNKILKSIFKGDDDEGYESLYEILNKTEKVTFEDVFKNKQTKNGIASVAFYRKAVGDIAFFLNAVEDVRIDSLTQPNLKKYIDVGDKKHAPRFVEEYEKGSYDENTLLNVGYRFLFHHKLFLQDDYINNTYGDLQELLNSTPFQWIPKVFDIYQELFKTHIESLFNANEDKFNDDVSGSYSDIMNEFDDESEQAQDAMQSLDDIQKALKDLDIEETELRADADVSKADKVSRKYKDEVEIKMNPLSQGLIDQIEIMGKVKIYENTETLSNDHQNTWNTIILDTV
tara:strand:+ start:3225 stop:4427 length:1203 start_codon:yes stop_codon:yes gene_type:complete